MTTQDTPIVPVVVETDESFEIHSDGRVFKDGEEVDPRWILTARRKLGDRY